MKHVLRLLTAGCLIGAVMAPAQAGESDVTAVSLRAESGGKYSFSVTLRHADEGWEHYADRWEVLTLEGKVLATRTLFHPHVNEQPFTRSLGGVQVPSGATAVRIRSHDKVHEHGGVELVVDLKTGDTKPWEGN
ncbi:MAG: hypothetical protein HOJ90_00890 [Alphaproteobacteria bacterium]|jgi:hypothetical protein|nr:hypothetical protein [Alphaproteobacteria bacterium]